jgi:D-alanyl-D-alanine carboxypeptidase
MLKVSANDAAWAIADGTVGRAQFIAAMNAEAGRLGMSHTHFENPVGYPDNSSHYSTARDLAVLAQVASSRFPLLAELANAKDAQLPASAGHPAFSLHNILGQLYREYPSVVAAKSGFTGLAGPCLVALATRGEHHLVSVLLHAPKVFDHTSALLDWGFTREGLPALLKAPVPLPVRKPAKLPVKR